MSDFVTLKELGQLLGTTSHVVGRTLKEVGLRTKKGKPTRAAFVGGYCDQRWSEGKYVWAWEKGKTVRVLDEEGLGTPHEPAQRTAMASAGSAGHQPVPQVLPPASSCS